MDESPVTKQNSFLKKFSATFKCENDDFHALSLPKGTDEDATLLFNGNWTYLQFFKVFLNFKASSVLNKWVGVIKILIIRDHLGVLVPPVFHDCC